MGIKNYSIVVLIFILFSTTLFSCRSNKMNNSNYVRNYYDSISYKELYTIKTDDKISVSIWNHDEMSIGSIYGVYNSNEVYGKWIMVDKQGEAALPGIGRINLLNLNTQQAADSLKILYVTTIKNPIISVKILNKEVSILGELRKPGKYVLEKEENSILEIISKAEGFDYYADKKRVRLVREESGKTIEYKLDFRNEYISYLANLNLKPGDIIYVQSKKGKSLDKKAPTILPIASLITAMILMINFLGGK